MQNYEEIDTFQQNRAEQILGLFAWLADLAVDLDIQARIIQLGLEKVHFEGLLMPNDREIDATEMQTARTVLGLIDQQITWLQQNLQA